MTWAAQHQSLLALVYGTAGLVALGYALRTLLPTGTLSSRPGLPTVVASRALIAGAYAGMEAYLPLTMSAVHGYSPALAGLPLTITALGWSAASAAQGRYLNWSREASLRTGFWLVAAGLVCFGLVSQPWFPAWPAFVACAVGGAGMGIAMPAISVLLLRYSPEGERGFNTSAMQLADWVGSRAAHRPGRRPARRGRLGSRPFAGDGPAHGRLGGPRAAGGQADRTLAVEGVTAHFEGQGGLRHAVERTTLKER